MGLRSTIARFVEGRRPATGEAALATSQLLRRWNLYPYSPDDLTTLKGKGLALYREMLRDGQVKAAILGKILSVVAREWQVQPASDDEGAVEVAEFVSWAIGNARGLFVEDLRKIAWALITGVSITEKIWRPPTGRGRFGAKWGLEALKDKDPDAFDFKCDAFGNITDLVQFPRGGKEIVLDPEKFIIFSHLMQYGNWWGTSDLRAAYRAFWLKDTVMKFRAIFAERYAQPTIVAKFARGTSEADVAKLRTIIETWQNETGVVIPEDQILEVLQKSTATEDVYKSFIADCNQEIVIAIQGAVLQMLEGARTGARAATETHAATADVFVVYLSAALANAVNEDLVRPLVDYNYEVEEYPTWQFVDPPGDLLNQAQTDRIVVRELGLPVARRAMYRRYRLPEPKEGEEVLEMPAGGLAGAAGLPGVTPFAEGGRRRAADLADLQAAEDAAVAEAVKDYDRLTARVRAAAAKKKSLMG